MTLPAQIQLPHGVTRRDLVEDRALWAVMSAMYLLFAGTCLALELRTPDPSTVTVALMGVGLCLGLLIALMRPPAPGTLLNLAVLLTVCISSLVGLCTPHSEVFIGAVIFVGPQLALRLNGRQQVAMASGVYVAAVAVIGVAGLLGLMPDMSSLTALAVLMLVPTTPILALTFETTLYTGERQGEVLERLTRRDALTGIHNRRGMMEELDAAIERARESGGTVAVLALDLNGFKAINDDHGHPAGDRALIDAARALRAAYPTPAVVTRLGGDEFCVILTGELAERDDLRTAAAAALAQVATPSGALTAGAGVARFPADGADLDAVLRSADARMRLAKPVVD